MKKWDLEITSKTEWWQWNLKEVWRYRDPFGFLYNPFLQLWYTRLFLIE